MDVGHVGDLKVLIKREKDSIESSSVRTIAEAEGIWFRSRLGDSASIASHCC